MQSGGSRGKMMVLLLRDRWMQNIIARKLGLALARRQAHGHVAGHALSIPFSSDMQATFAPISAPPRLFVRFPAEGRT